MSAALTILESNGKPAFVVLPYDEYLKLTGVPGATAGRIPADGSTPHEVMALHVRNEWSMIRAWREHLGLTQAEMARRLDIRQPSYAAMEAADAKPKKATRERIAAAMGITIDQLS
ncbi:helix-turn-helix transcriptional regulator [Achromobacter sp. GG226]|uniref:helix-turn-helix transcriptional regulator n=1 Tax=Verticiella alkaliphila TaxID=2779529 RepID=UPI00209ADB92|nr:helix-turn-helix transcriptional regulator [Verticiella sp. GG226]MBU4609481.1 helix-turn-helix transcriptional regulator [Verticiella sp. GG226]